MMMLRMIGTGRNGLERRNPDVLYYFSEAAFEGGFGKARNGKMTTMMMW